MSVCALASWRIRRCVPCAWVRSARCWLRHRPYLERHGSPRVPADLREHTLIASTAGGFGGGWRFAAADHALKVNPRLKVTTNDGALDAALSGFGIARLLSYQVAAEVQAGRLRLLMPEYDPPSYPVHILHREGRHASTRVRAFIDLMADKLRKDAALNPAFATPVNDAQRTRN